MLAPTFFLSLILSFSFFLSALFAVLVFVISSFLPHLLSRFFSLSFFPLHSPFFYYSTLSFSPLYSPDFLFVVSLPLSALFPRSLFLYFFTFLISAEFAIRVSRSRIWIRSAFRYSYLAGILDTFKPVYIP